MALGAVGKCRGILWPSFSHALTTCSKNSSQIGTHAFLFKNPCRITLTRGVALYCEYACCAKNNAENKTADLVRGSSAGMQKIGLVSFRCWIKREKRGKVHLKGTRYFSMVMPCSTPRHLLKSLQRCLLTFSKKNLLKDNKIVLSPKPSKL